MQREFSRGAVGRSRQWRGWAGRSILSVLLTTAGSCLIFQAVPCMAQIDQGTITGTVTDSSGAVVPSANITLTNTDTGLVLKSTANKAGVYVFSPIKIGNYTVAASAPGFSTASLPGLVLNVNQRLSADLKLQAGNVAQTVTVNSGAAQLLETQQSSTGQVVSSQVINDTPLNGRNYVFIAQLTAGVTQANGSRGEGKGDFNANGQRAEQNNFVLDGVDNNSNAVDFLNGASFVVKPPPDALAEFKVQTSNYDAQFGHSAGGVINASIKSGSNGLHGNLWEYWRNDALDAVDYFAKSKPKYRQNQFGGTIGGPIIKDHLFFFGDVEANRIIFGETGTYTVPTALMRQGNFTELLNPALTGKSQPTLLYQPGSKGSAPLACNGVQNVFCPGQINPIAQGLLNLYPLPNANGGKAYNNYVVNRNNIDNTVQWDGRIDWNATAHDQAFFRMSYYNERGDYAPPLGPILDGGSYGSDGPTINMGENFALSETHEFTQTLANEFRFGYNWGHFQFLQPGAQQDVAPTVGLGGIPFQKNNGGLPSTSITGISSFGSPGFYPAIEYENVFQILDNVTKVAGNHTLKGGVAFQHVRFSTTAPTNPHGGYNYTGFYTSIPGQSFTGWGVADFLADQQNSAGLSNYFNIDNVRWYNSGYFQDDWRILPRLTLNLGIRYDWYQPTQERHDNQANWYPTAINGPGSGTGNYVLIDSKRNVPLAPTFLNLIAQNNINLVYTSNRSLINSQNTDFSPRVGFAYSPTDRFVVRGGFGIFFGGLESIGGAPNPGFNYPFSFSSTFTAPGCSATANVCPTDGLTLATGFQNAINQGLQNFLSTPGLVGSQTQFRASYSEQYNLSTQYAFSPTLSLTVGYVGNVSRRLTAFADQNAPFGLVGPADSSQNIRPFPGFGGSQFDSYEGVASYNSGQVTLEKHNANGLYFLATYTYGHALDDTATPLNGGGNIYRSALIVPIGYEYTNSDWDVRHRATLNASYQLPFGKGRRYLNRGGVLNQVAGGWAADLVFVAQTGNPFTVSPNNSGAVGATTRRAIRLHDPYATGGSADPSNAGTTCAAKTKNINNWFNPCAFGNPLPGSNIPNTQTATDPIGHPLDTLSTVLPYVGTARNQIYGPGYERINMSVFKNFSTYESQYLQVRADIFNLFNTPAFGQPGNGSANDNSTGAPITNTRSLGAFTPNPRFFQLAAKYYF
jgi:outer membrane receptor protein involved in Fe transport